MNEVHNVEFSLDCEGGERTIYFLLHGSSLQLTVLELRGPEESGPDWTGATGTLDVHGCEMAATLLKEWIRDQDPHKREHEECLTLIPQHCLFAWRNTNENATHFRPKPGLDKIHIHFESLRDARFLHGQFAEFARRLTWR